VSFADWVKNGWVVAHKSSKQEIGNLLGIVARDLKDSQAKHVSDDWRFAIAYNAALQAATAALAAAGRITGGPSLSRHSVTGNDCGKTLSSFADSTGFAKSGTLATTISAEEFPIGRSRR
jgi:hypothetical protein